jgi:hypothetical protein
MLMKQWRALGCPLFIHRLLSSFSKAPVGPQNGAVLARSTVNESFPWANSYCRNISTDTVAGQKSDADGQDGTTASWVPQWMRSKLPASLGGDGTREQIREMEDLDMDSYLKQLKMARRLGSMTGSAFGTSNASDFGSQGFLLLSEKVIERMTPEERADISTFTIERRRFVAQDVDCSMEQIDDCIARFSWTKHMMKTLAEHRKRGHDMPSTMDELEKITGTWRQFRSQSGAPQSVQSSGSITLPIDAVSPKDGKPCGLAGMSVGRSTKCPRFRKSYKACCGRAKKQ